jgi:hypothetical protein
MKKTKKKLQYIIIDIKRSIIMKEGKLNRNLYSFTAERLFFLLLFYNKL